MIDISRETIKELLKEIDKIASIIVNLENFTKTISEDTAGYDMIRHALNCQISVQRDHLFNLIQNIDSFKPQL